MAARDKVVCELGNYVGGKSISDVIDELSLDKANNTRFVDAGSLHVATVVPMSMHALPTTKIMSVTDVSKFMKQNEHILNQISLFNEVTVFSAKIIRLGNMDVLSFNTLVPDSVGDVIDKHTSKIAHPMM